MCLYTKYLDNPKYKPNKKNGFNPPICNDERLAKVPVKCGKCYECRKEKQRDWIIRLSEELKHEKGTFITLTFDDKSLNNIEGKSLNEKCTKALRMCLERCRKKTGKSVKHWVVTELGETTGRIHLHGIFFKGWENIIEKWQYGNTWVGTFCNERTIKYITKYMLKENQKDKTYTPIVLCSAGIGKQYIGTFNQKQNCYKGENTKQYYRTKEGYKLALPQYYRKKIYNEEEREKLWIIAQEKGYRYLMGEKVRTDDTEKWEKLTTYWQKYCQKVHGDNPGDWDKQKARRKIEKYIAYKKKSYEQAKKVINKL